MKQSEVAHIYVRKGEVYEICEVCEVCKVCEVFKTYEVFDVYIYIYIWVKIIRMGNMHFSCHFFSVFILTWSQNEPPESRKKTTQLTSTPRRVMGLHCFYCKLAQSKTTNY